MKMRSSAQRLTLGVILACITQLASADIANLPSDARVLDPDVIFHGWPYPTISPDGQWVAYISKGFVCVCNIQEPRPRQLFEVPGTWTHVLALPDNAHAGGDSGALARGLSRDNYNKLLAQITHTVFGLQWTVEQDGLAFGVQTFDRGAEKVISDFWHVSLGGAVTSVAHVEEPFNSDRTGNRFFLARGRNYVVIPGFRRPLIWNLTTNKPRATCFLHLTPSPSSGRWIGIEKDTRQLVITDENFQIVKRFNETRAARSFGFELDWSPDEHFIIWRNQIGFDHFSNWEGFWMNLDTGEKRKLEGRFMNERFGFTGRGGEFWRCGVTGAKTNWYDAVVGAHLTIIPEGEEPPHDVWRIVVDPKNPKTRLADHRLFPPLRPNGGCNLFAIGLPRPTSEPTGWIWHLIDRDGNTWRFPGEDNGKFISPFEVVSFAGGSKTIIAHDEKRLFSLPVSAIKAAASKAQ